VDAARVDKPLLEPLPLAPLERRRLEPRRRRGARGVAAREEALLLDDARAEAHVVPRVEPVHPHAAVGVEVAVELEAVLGGGREGDAASEELRQNCARIAPELRAWSRAATTCARRASVSARNSPPPHGSDGGETLRCCDSALPCG
jgi:hypothetical protein